MTNNLNQCFVCNKDKELFICNDCYNQVGKKDVMFLVKNLDIPKAIKTDIYRNLRKNVKKRKPDNALCEFYKPFIVKIEVGSFTIEP